MTTRGRILLAISLTALLCGMSLGGRIFYLTACLGLLSLLYAFFSILLSRFRLRVTQRLSSGRVLRGEETALALTVSRRGLLPVCPLYITVRAGDSSLSACAQPSSRREQRILLPLSARHVGVFPVRTESYTYYDMLGLCRARVRCREEAELLVLPRVFDVEPLRFFSGDDGRTLQNRTTEDLSSPEDVRAYHRGDPLKRVHWKLSARKRELIVRRFETPAPPDTLVLLDCAQPGQKDTPENERLMLRDALCETALSVISMQLALQSPVRLPLYGRQAQEFHSSNADDLSLAQELLARQPFQGGVEFERVLHMELRRMRQTGATVIITTRLNAAMIESITHIRRMGPNARVYLVTSTPDAAQDRPYVAQLQQCLVEVCYVTPA